MLVGDSGVGKTCLLVRFKDGAFLAGSFISTVGIDFRVSAWGGLLGLCPRGLAGEWWLLQRRDKTLLQGFKPRHPDPCQRQPGHLRVLMVSASESSGLFVTALHKDGGARPLLWVLGMVRVRTTAEA